MYRKDYSLFRRRCRDGFIWYYRTYDPYGRRTVARSTGETNKTLAERYCNKLLREGTLVPARVRLFCDYAKNWWEWDRCPYIRGKLKRSRAGKPNISRTYTDDMRAALVRYVLPTFQDQHLDAITVPAIEKWMDTLLDSGLSPKRVNNITSCLRVMLREAKRQGLIPRDPFDVIKPFADNCRERGVLSLDEVRELFAEQAIATAWLGNLLYRAVNMLAAASGMRQGEILAVRDEVVHDGWIHVEHSWDLKYGLQPTKTRQARDVPVPPKVIDAMRPFVGSGGFVFSLSQGERPATGNRITEALYAALEKIGISAEERQQRAITFHSWRHWFNSTMRARQIPTSLLQRVTGHATVEMTERYTSYVLADYAPVLAVQQEVFK